MDQKNIWFLKLTIIQFLLTACIQFMNSSLDVLVNNLPHNDFKYLLQEFRGDLLELVKPKGVYPYEYMDSFKKFSEDKLPNRC